MGKKKPQKTKELSVAIAEASSAADETGQQQSQPQIHQQTQPQIPRKRGRPRKIIEKKEEPVPQPAAVEGTESLALMKKGKTSEEEEHEQEQHGPQQEGSSACIRVSKEEGVSGERQLPRGEPSRSRARRKSKPRKSS